MEGKAIISRAILCILCTGLLSFVSVQAAEKSADETLCDQYQIRANNGEALAQVQLGNCYLRGIGREEDVGRAVFWFEESIDNGSTMGMANLASAHLFGKVADPDYEYAVELLRNAVEAGIVSTAHFSLGLAYNNGLGVARDRATAVTHIREAADAGHTMARFVLLASYRLGLLGLPQDDQEAEMWEKKLEEALRFEPVEPVPTVQQYATSVLDEWLLSEFVFDDHELRAVARCFRPLENDMVR